MGGSIGGRRKGRAGFAEINVTPFVDVMLVLLIVFMITAPLLAAGLKVKLPEVKANETEVKDSKLIVSVSKDEKITLGENDVTNTLEIALIQDERIQKEKELYVRADKDARYGVVARVVAAARRAGVTSLNLMVQPELEDDPAAKKPTPVKVAPTTTPDPAPSPKKK